MNADHFVNIEKFEADLWQVADNLRANSPLASNDYFMPILGLIFLRHATNRYYEVLKRSAKPRPQDQCRTARCARQISRLVAP